MTAKVIATVKDNLNGQVVTGDGIVVLVPNQYIVACADFLCFMPWKAKHNEISINIQNLDDTESEVKVIMMRNPKRPFQYFFVFADCTYRSPWILK